jgi:hypothetical protein
MNEVLDLLQRLYLRQIANDIKLRVVASNGSSKEEIESLRAEGRRLEADIYPIARNLGEFADIARGGAYLAFIGSANEGEAEMAKRDYGCALREAQARRHHHRRH